MKRILHLVIFGLISTAVGAFYLGSTAQAMGGFDPGRIIDDEIFYDKDAMGTARDVQRFIESHTPSSCDTWGDGQSGYGGLTRAQYATQIRGWHGPPYVCLQNYHENPNTGETSFDRGGGAFSGGVNVGQMVWDAAQKYSINPQVLLVLLRKESAGPLFADSWPLKSQYTYAMGYGCPDSGPGYSANCNATQGGFYKQVMRSAYQLKLYKDNMTSYNYQPGRTNRILYNPDPSCGFQDVYIRNYATASLYNYTPYVPNQAALSAYPGEASCGAYGNRNFWHFFREWFGSTTIDSNFYRTVNDATVYLVSDNVKYPVASGSLIDAASPLGGVGFTSQSYLDKIPTGDVMDRLIRSPDGTVYLFDSGIKLPFPSCSLVEDYGYTCGESKLLTKTQVDAFHTGPRVTKGMKTTSGKSFYISNGQKREVYDQKSLADNGLSVSYNVLNEGVLGRPSYGPPIVRNDTIIESRSGSSSVLAVLEGKVYDISKGSSHFASLGRGRLDSQSVSKLTVNGRLGDFIRDSAGKLYIITRDGKKEVVDDSIASGMSVLEVGTYTASVISGSGRLSSPSLVKSMNNATVYAVIGGEKRPILSMSDLSSITGDPNPYVAWVSNSMVESIDTGNVVVRVASMVKTPNSSTVYLTDGYDSLIPMSSFVHTDELGVKGRIANISNSILSKYNVSSAVLDSYISCGEKTYLGVGGSLYPFSANDRKTPTQVSVATCNALKVRGGLPGFILDPSGTIYSVDANVIRPISSWNKYLSLSGGSAPVRVSSHTLTFFTRGPVL